MLEDVEMPCEAGGVPGGSKAQTAAVELTDASAGIGCLNDCSGHGVCVDNECRCLEQFTGDDCRSCPPRASHVYTIMRAVMLLLLRKRIAIISGTQKAVH
jgi:hypothetical protein